MLSFLQRGLQTGQRGALLTLVDSSAGSVRPVGAQMAVVEDGSFTGYLSSGCLEAVLAAEAVGFLRKGQNAIRRFGAGSPYLDIRLPCGGSIDVLFDVTLDAGLLGIAVGHLHARRAFCLASGADREAALAECLYPTGWRGETFCRSYSPALRLVVLGRGLEFEAVVRLAAAAGYPVKACCADDSGMERLHGYCPDLTRLSTADHPSRLELDENTAVLLLFHDHEWEVELLDRALNSPCCYLGAMGSIRSHALRRERLIERGHSIADVDRIRGPIGLFGPTRDASSLAISVMAQIAQLRLPSER